MKPLAICTNCRHHLSEHQTADGAAEPCTHGDDTHRRMDPDCGERCTCESYEGPGAPQAEPEPKSKAVTPRNLHRHHAGHDSKAGGWRVDLPGGVTARLEGGTKGLRQAIAYRIAFTWNMAEGIATEALEEGHVGDAAIAAVGLGSAAELFLGDTDNPKAWELLKTRLKEHKAAEARLEIHGVDCECSALHDRYAKPKGKAARTTQLDAFAEAQP